MYEESTTTYYTTRTDFQPQYQRGSVNANLDPSYLRTLPGMLKVVVIVLDFLCFFCVLVGGPGYYAGVGFATFVSVIGFMISLTLLILYLCHIVDNLENIPWIVGEMVYCFAWTIFFFIAGSVLAVASVSHRNTTGWALAAFFAIAAMCAYGLDCYLKFLAWKNDEVAKGGGVSYNPRPRVEHF
ncbi:unnamed protein product [Bursaphelenchus okinawaensis]|uniref:MARVEL domain-containing protein n=1 Tax=Bursaphelenchus okinawaensis TaxID=465554 RepID=A0A811JSC4_9BILA|nr:unnamed protein product [Bursaphelenchus okinawaensis]CAG9080966.1 unnamed protein product [Bursaphelenchus okinawaensis]